MKTIDGNTQVACVIGNPIEHTLSPLMHNHAFARMKLNWVYIPFLVNDIEDAVAGMRALSIRGASVTIPFKRSVIPFLDAVDPAARLAGSVNTIVYDHGKLTGYSSDGYGAVRALKECSPIAGKNIVVLGNGGSTSGILSALRDEAPSKITIVGRDRNKVNAFIASMGGVIVCDGMLFSDAVRERCAAADIIINTTSVGMHPEVNASPIPEDCIMQRHVVFDIVYTPKDTLLLRYARTRGAKIVYGYKMLLHQAAVQFELWTKMPFPTDAVDTVLSRELARRDHG
ncbi:MAG: shikimate dehydrogenase [Spirochaetota bacterium]